MQIANKVKIFSGASSKRDLEKAGFTLPRREYFQYERRADTNVGN